MTADTVQPLLVKLPLAGTQTFAGRSQNPYYITALYYPFISMGAIPSILPQDLQFLESQCCIHVPTRPIMDELMRQYFLHLHPMLPIINEASFWNIYSSDTGEYALDDRIPLIVLQAMLFACCNFVPLPFLRNLGFGTARVARAAFYRRAKLLFDLNAESCPIALSQAALLLSSWSLFSAGIQRNPSIPWLDIAIQQAKNAEAHNHEVIRTWPKRRAVLKRLWWCCIIRDRIFGMGMRNGIKITRNDFDFQIQNALGFADLSDEIENSKVHDPGTKRRLVEIFELLIELCIMLTDILDLAFPLETSSGWREVCMDEEERVTGYKLALERWHRRVVLKFPELPSQTRSCEQEVQHGTVTLCLKLLFMYHYSAKVVLSHHEILQLAMSPISNSASCSRALILEDNLHELQDATSGITDCLADLIHLELAQWLPISAVACTALPLFLYILDVKVLSSPRNFVYLQPEGKERRLMLLVEAMKTYHPQYDGVDWVSETIRHAICLARWDHATLRQELENDTRKGIDMAGWTEMLSSRPGWYLRLALTIDLSLSKGRFPEDRDFPVGLRGLLVDIGQRRPLLKQIEQKAVARSDSLVCVVRPPLDFEDSISQQSVKDVQHPGIYANLDKKIGVSEKDLKQSHGDGFGEPFSSDTIGFKPQEDFCLGDLALMNEPVEGFDMLADEVFSILSADNNVSR
ncbi:fungal-specific transcription factor domain-containing protein [Ilyonectria robusta]|uniref:fungal-specific transcription factor domain-containing protein n=1 Tax=Ilyonectria robusta TaxID=1079257 RepID=UPI001E8EB0C6|nr:fungal-specific transcription factor domain-containing protein [Ilyonectria robusta]KAH8675040.1 fungal-specific transcription factor domain-containing protein [Ilyonectria robusta]